jgi:hypothetical protein
MTFRMRNTIHLPKRGRQGKTLEGMVDGMSLKGVLRLLDEEIAYEKTEHLRDIESRRAASAVEPTRSENITVTCRRSAVS